MRAGSRHFTIGAGVFGYVVLCLVGCPAPDTGVSPGVQLCLQCHNGVEAPYRLEFPVGTHKFLECERCHGEGYLHIRVGGRNGLHIVDPSELPFHQTYATCAECHARRAEEFVESVHAQAQAATCFTCHDVHTPEETVLPIADNTLCLSCHQHLGFPDDEAVQAHTRHPVDPLGTGASRCTSCHMPPLRRTNQDDGPHDHTWATIPPIASALAAEAGVTPVPPNSCAGTAGCHDGTIPTAPLFDVDNPDVMRVIQNLYEAWYLDDKVGSD